MDSQPAPDSEKDQRKPESSQASDQNTIQEGKQRKEQKDKCKKNERKNFYNSVIFYFSLLKSTDWIIAICTIVIAITAILNVIYVRGQLSEMKSSGQQMDAIIISNTQLASAAKIQAEAIQIESRAWIAPRYVTLNSPIIPGQKIGIRIIYENSGKTPAFNLEYHSTGKTIVDNSGNIVSPDGYRNIRLGENLSCFEETKVFGGIVYPSSTKFGSTTDFFMDDINLTSKVINRLTIIAIQSCYRYQTLGVWHKSMFCDYLDPIADKPPDQWVFHGCADGYGAD